MLGRACLILAIAMLAPAVASAQEEEPRVRCGEQYMTVMVTGGKDPVTAGPLTIRKADVRAIYATYSDRLTIFADIGKTIIQASIEREALKPVLECLN